MSYSERAERLRAMARRISYRCYDVRQNLLWDADELDRGIYPGSVESWRSTDIDLLGG